MNVKVKRQWLSGLMQSISFIHTRQWERKSKVLTVEHLIGWH